MRTTNELPEAPMTTTTRTARKDRKPPTRTPETAAAEAAIEANTAEVRPVVTLTPEAQARLEKERAKLEREQKAAARRQSRIEALERGETLPAATSGLPPVVKMNELGALARQLHRAYQLTVSGEVVELMRKSGASESEASTASWALKGARNEAIRRWLEQFEQRREAGAADNDTLAPLGLTREDDEWVLVEKKKPEKSEAA